MNIPVSDQLSALAHERRLDVFRLLMRRYPDAVPAGEIAQALGLRANTTSVYLSILRHAGLISQTRSGTFQLYRIRLDNVRGLFGDMLGDCCRGRPDICLPDAIAAPLAPPSTDTPLRVLFLCGRNSARSIMAEALLRAAGPQYAPHSAGTVPAEAPDPDALAELTRQGLPTEGLQSQAVSRFLGDSPPMDMVITVCDRAANEDVIRWPGAPLHAHWGIDDPLAADPGPARRQAMAGAFAQLRARIEALSNLTPGLLTPAHLQAQLDDIGRLGTLAPAS